jgi:hypothetical protein
VFRLLEVKPLSGCRLWLHYSDGTEGEVDLSHLAGKGVFARWTVPGEFEQVRLSDHGAPAWGESIDLCPDSLYLELTGRRAEDVFAGLQWLK